MISIESVTLRVAEALDVCGIPFLLVGAFSSNHYGIPRSTKDADFVLQLKSAVGDNYEVALGKEQRQRRCEKCDVSPARKTRLALY
jgi:hypothetical protein